MTAPIDIDEELRRKIVTAVNVGQDVLSVAAEHGVSPHVVRRLAKCRHVFREDKGGEGHGRVLHHGEAERWASRPQRASDAARRTAARAARDETLAKFGLSPRPDDIIVPGAAPSLGDWRARGRRGAKAQKARDALDKAEGTAKRPARKPRTFDEFDDD